MVRTVGAECPTMPLAASVQWRRSIFLIGSICTVRTAKHRDREMKAHSAEHFSGLDAPHVVDEPMLTIPWTAR